jgi:hypothetical protein
MPTPTSIGNVAFREISRTEGTSSDGRYTITIRRKGAASNVDAERAYLSGLQFLPENPSMLADSWSIDDGGPVATSEIVFTGLSTERIARVDLSSRVTQQTVKLATDTGDEVSFVYFTQETTWTWNSTTQPRSPRFGRAPSTRFRADELLAPNPARYSGSVENQYRVVNSLVGFDIQGNDVSGWTATETWQQRVEPV